MAGKAQGVLRGEHLGLEAKPLLKLAVINFRISRRQDDHGAFPVVEGDGLGNMPRLHSQGLGGQLHRGAAYLKGTDALKAPLGKPGAGRFHAHAPSLLLCQLVCPIIL